MMKRCTSSIIWPGLIVAASYLSECLAMAVQPLIRDYSTTIDVCNVVKSVTKVYIIEPIYINTYVQHNTTFAVNDYLTITVEDAPTSFDGIVKGTTTTQMTSSYMVYDASSFWSGQS